MATAASGGRYIRTARYAGLGWCLRKRSSRIQVGGTLTNIPVLVSASAPAGSLTLIDGSDLLIGDRGRANIGFSDSTSIDMDSEPDGSRRISLYQSEAIALKVSREISWKLRDGFVSFAANLDLPLPILPS